MTSANANVDDTGPVAVALFPIPSMVAFPGTVIPLHVFEPRYRTLVRDCMREERMVAVCHTARQIRPARVGQSLDEALKTNQATYQPVSVFSAGRCELLEVLPDGRLRINVHAGTRLRLLAEVQTLPYRIASCEPLEDEPTDVADSREHESLRDAINERLVKLVEPDNERLARALEREGWRHLPPADYSFKVFQFLRMDAEVMQAVLECTRVGDRLQVLWQVVSEGVPRG